MREHIYADKRVCVCASARWLNGERENEEDKEDESKFLERKGESEREEERGVALRLVHARTPTSGTHVTRPDRYALPKPPRSLSLSLSHPSALPSSSHPPMFVAFLFATLFSSAFSGSLPPAFLPSFASLLRFPLGSRVTDRSYVHARQLPSTWFQRLPTHGEIGKSFI